MATCHMHMPAPVAAQPLTKTRRLKDEAQQAPAEDGRFEPLVTDCMDLSDLAALRCWTTRWDQALSLVTLQLAPWVASTFTHFQVISAVLRGQRCPSRCVQHVMCQA